MTDNNIYLYQEPQAQRIQYTYNKSVGVCFVNQTVVGRRFGCQVAMIALTIFCYLSVFLFLCSLSVESKPQHHNLYGDFYGNRAGQQSAMQFNGHNPYSSFSDEMALIQQYLPLHPFQKLLIDSQIGFQQDEDEDDENGRGFFTYTHTMTETRHRGDVRTVYCTTSTTAISTCSPSGRRKRFSKGVRGLFYNEEVQKINFEEDQMKIEDDSNALLHTFTNEK